jgi:hypothetical protein
VARPQKLREATFLIDPKSVELPPKGTPVVLDIETTGLDPRNPRVFDPLLRV